MEKLSMCRICLVENVRMYVVTNKSLQQMYEKLTDVPFVTEDYRPMLACSICCTKLKQCCQLQRKCLEAEELLAQMLSEDYEHKLSTDQENLEFVGRFIISPIENINIVEESQCNAIKQELADVCVEQCDVELKVERLSEEFESEDLNKSLLGIKAHRSESLLEDEVVMEIKQETEEEELPELRQRVSVMEKFESEDLNKSLLGIKAHRSESLLEDEVVMEIKQETEEEELPELRQRASVMEMSSNTIPLLQRSEELGILQTSGNATASGSPSTKISKIYLRRGGKVVTTKQMKNQPSELKSIRTIENCASKSVTKFKEPVIISSTAVDNCAVNTIIETLYHQNINDSKNNFHLNSSNKIINIDDINKHQILGKKPSKCDLCLREFSKKGDLKRHICRQTAEKPFTCDICQRSFTHKQSLHYHITTHTGQTPHKCILCQRSFTNTESLKYHIRTHTGEKPHKCTECDRSFSTKTYLNNHIRTHTGEKPHKCDICQRSFRMKSHLNNHIRAHTGEKPYKCDVCQRGFISSSYLTKHIRIHTGEKPFKCTICQRSFTHRTSLTYHIKTHTGEKHNN